MISIGLPIYKVDFLEQAIDSVLNQTHQDYELIILNDNSPYDVEKILNKYGDSRIRYYKNLENIGMKDLSKVWNKCLEYAKGDEFILFNDDDVYEKTFIEELYRLSKKYQNTNLFHTRVKLINENGDHIKYAPLCPEYETGVDFIWHKLNDFRLHFAPDFMCRTKYLKALGGFTSMPLAWGTDDLTWFKLSLKGGVVYSSKPLCSYRVSSNSITSSGGTIQRLEAIDKYGEWITSFVKNAKIKNDDEMQLIQDISLKQKQIIMNKKEYIIGIEFKNYGFLKLNFKMIKWLVANQIKSRILMKIYIRRFYEIISNLT
tara:strand:- start:109 stop:1056 length:948 start_codon:yes stop_codon:yes gene_type:complete